MLDNKAPAARASPTTPHVRVSPVRTSASASNAVAIDYDNTSPAHIHQALQCIMAQRTPPLLRAQVQAARATPGQRSAAKRSVSTDAPRIAVHPRAAAASLATRSGLMPRGHGMRSTLTSQVDLTALEGSLHLAVPSPRRFQTLSELIGGASGQNASINATEVTTRVHEPRPLARLTMPAGRAYPLALAQAVHPLSHGAQKAIAAAASAHTTPSGRGLSPQQRPPAESVPPPPPSPTALRSLTRIRELGRGSYACVDLVRDDATGALYARKTMSWRTRNGHHHNVARNDAAMLANCAHPNIVQFVAGYTDDEAQTLTLVMEYVQGTTLANEIRRNHRNFAAPPRAAVLDIFVQLCLAVHHLHSNGLVHRDIKSDNVLLASLGRGWCLVKLADFGFATEVALADRERVGTPFYAAPEVLSAGVATIDARADVWALGVVLFELAALDKPFPGTTVDEIRAKVAEDGLEIPSFVDAEVAQVIRMLLQRDPARRPTCGELLVDTPCLAHALAGYEKRTLLELRDRRQVDALNDQLAALGLRSSCRKIPSRDMLTRTRSRSAMAASLQSSRSALPTRSRRGGPP
jgi:serine/threonine protein kinase